MGQTKGRNAGARVRTVDIAYFLECIFRGDGFHCLFGERKGIFQRLDDVVLVGQSRDRFRVNGRLYTESTEKEILRIGNVRDLLAKGSYSLKFTAGGDEIVFVSGHGLGGCDYFLGLTAEELSIDFRGGGGRRKGRRDE